MAKLGVEAISLHALGRRQRGRRGAGARGAAEDPAAATPSRQPLYPDGMKLADKIRTIAQKIYRAADIAVPDAVARRLEGFEKAGFGHVPVCIAKTQYSFTSDPTVMGAPEGHTMPVREVRLSAGAGFVVAICGDIMTMPGLPRMPSAEAIHLREDGEIEGLF